MEFMSLIEAAHELAERREFLCKNPPSCPVCEERKQIQLVRWGALPADWKCRICTHKFMYEPGN